jgi:hypothetical protein
MAIGTRPPGDTSRNALLDCHCQRSTRPDNVALGDRAAQLGARWVTTTACGDQFRQPLRLPANSRDTQTVYDQPAERSESGLAGPPTAPTSRSDSRDSPALFTLPGGRLLIAAPPSTRQLASMSEMPGSRRDRA